MIDRYTRDEIGALWTDAARFESWRLVEVAACEELDGPTEQDLEAIRAALTASPLIDRVIHLRTLHVGPDELLVGAKIAIRDSATGTQIAAGIDAAERSLRAAVPSARYIYLEPDLDRLAGEANPG